MMTVLRRENPHHKTFNTFNIPIKASRSSGAISVSNWITCNRDVWDFLDVFVLTICPELSAVASDRQQSQQV